MNITSGGVARTYLRRIPAGYDATKPAPVVFAIHGLGEGSQTTPACRSGPRGRRTRVHRGLSAGSRGSGRLEHDARVVGLAFFGHLLDEVEADLVRPPAGLRGRPLDGCVHVVVDRLPVSSGSRRWGSWPACGTPAMRAEPGGSRGDVHAPRTRGLVCADPGIIDAWAARKNRSPTPSEVPMATDVIFVRYFCPRGSEVGFYRSRAADTRGRAATSPARSRAWSDLRRSRSTPPTSSGTSSPTTRCLDARAGRRPVQAARRSYVRFTGCEVGSARSAFIEWALLTRVAPYTSQ